MSSVTSKFLISWTLFLRLHIVHSESAPTPLLFPQKVTLQPYSKMDTIVFSPLINLHTVPHNDKVTTGIYYIYIQTLYSELCWSTLGSDYSLKYSWVWRYKLGTPVFGEFLPFNSADPLKLCQVIWGASLQSYFEVSPETFDRVQVWALPEPLKDFWRLPWSHSCVVLAVCLGLLSC